MATVVTQRLERDARQPREERFNRFIVELNSILPDLSLGVIKPDARSFALWEPVRAIVEDPPPSADCNFGAQFEDIRSQIPSFVREWDRS